MSPDKEKAGTERKLLVHGVGLLFSMPVVFVLDTLLVVLIIVLGVIIFFGSPESGVPSEFVPILLAIWGLAIFAFFALTYGFFRYGRGIGSLFHRLRGIRDEQARVERLVQGQVSAIDTEPDDRADFVETLQARQHKQS